MNKDEYGRVVVTVDCGLICPGCGISAWGYRDPISDEYQGVEEFNLNLKAISLQGNLVHLGENCIYRGVQYDQECSGYGQCCQSYELRGHPRSVELAREILLERIDSTPWEIQGVLLLLALEGTSDRRFAKSSLYLVSV